MNTTQAKEIPMKTTLSRRLLPVIAAAATTLALLPALAVADAGDLDPGFGAGGRATIHVKQGDFGFGGALAPDGKILIAGDVDFPADRTSGLARLTPGGGPDPSFGGGTAFATVNPTVAASDFTENVQLQPDGKILVGGSFDGSVGILRYRPDGLPDTGFSGDGMVKDGFGHPQRAGGVLLLPGGKLLWFGRGDYPSGAHDLDLVRYNANGSLDATFGAGGLVSHSIRPGNDLEQYHVAVLQPDGKILIGGEIHRGANGLDWTVARLHPDGSFDTSFDGDGRLATHFAGNDFLYDIVVQPDGKIVAVGARSGPSADIALARYLPDGSLDTTFSGDGRQVIDLGGDEIGRAIVRQPDGKIVIAGQTDAAAGNDDMVVSRIDASGVLDPSFGVDGTKFVDFTGGNDEAHDLLIQPDGKLVATGWAVVPGSVDFAAIRLEADPANTTGGPGATGADRAVTVRILGRRLPIDHRGVARLRLRCPRGEQSSPCQGGLAVRSARMRLGNGRAAKRRIMLGRAGFRIAAGRTKVVKLRVGPGKLRLLKRSRQSRRVVVLARVRDAVGNRRTVRKPLRAVLQARGRR
jgi:uncharacterized delta-60 repeat protein